MCVWNRRCYMHDIIITALVNYIGRERSHSDRNKEKKYILLLICWFHLIEYFCSENEAKFGKLQVKTWSIEPKCVSVRAQVRIVMENTVCNAAKCALEAKCRCVLLSLITALACNSASCACVE